MGLIVAYFELKIPLLTYGTNQLHRHQGQVMTAFIPLCSAGLKCQGMAALAKLAWHLYQVWLVPSLAPEYLAAPFY